MNTYKPHDYQQFATNYIVEHKQAAVFLDMGLGKTVITLTAIRELRIRGEVGRVLVIAPLRVARDTWPAELKKWEHLHDLRLSAITGTAEERRAAADREAEVYTINRENVPWLVQNIKWKWDMVVIDELSSFKNHTAVRFRALWAVRKNIKRIVGLTGTPAPNGLENLWAEFLMLDKGERLGRYVTKFRDNYLVPDKRSQMMIYSWKPKPGAVEAVKEKVADMTISMTAMEHLQMPELISVPYEVQMTEEERETYCDMLQDYVAEIDGSEITAMDAGSLCNKLLQLANGAVYDRDRCVCHLHDHKLEALEDIIEAAQGQPVLVAYWYKHDLARIKKQIPKAVRLDSAESIEAWNRGEIEVGLIHPASAGHGLNLQEGGSHIVWFGLTWSLELYQQTNARLWRQGQTSRTVVIQHIITADSIDGRVMQAIDSKDATQAAMVEAVKAVIG